MNCKICNKYVPEPDSKEGRLNWINWSLWFRNLGPACKECDPWVYSKIIPGSMPELTRKSLYKVKGS